MRTPQQSEITLGRACAEQISDREDKEVDKGATVTMKRHFSHLRSRNRAADKGLKTNDVEGRTHVELVPVTTSPSDSSAKEHEPSEEVRI